MANSLQIFKNGEDISGKGIRDSKQILEEVLPDIDMEMLSNIVVLGQGLPNRFSSFSPSGRKEILEKMFKADFMIEDIKSRLSKRLGELKDKKREIEDSILSLQTKQDVSRDVIRENEATLENLADIDALSDQVREYDKVIKDLDNKIDEICNENNKIKIENSKINEQLLQLKDKEIEINNSEYLVKEIEDIKEKGINLKNEVVVLDKEIEKKDSISDICPTCGQKLDGVEKPDTTNDKKKSMEMKATLDKYRETLHKYQDDRKSHLSKLLNDVRNKEEDLRAKLLDEIDTSKLEQERSDKVKIYTDLNNQLNSYNTKKSELEKIVAQNYDIVKNIDTKLTQLAKDKMSVEAKLEVNNKINSIVKRDFRGYLLSNIIDLIDKKCKEYSLVLFEHENINIKQDKNSISIKFNNKEYEQLSGGEKQKIDLCVQLSIRDILIKYSGFNSNIIVLDEIFDNLDEISSDRVLNLITSTLNIPSIYIITHHSSIPIPYDGKIIVNKSNKCSTAIQMV